jgi:drug/metabolite transporter (DMT)-like permease
MLAYLRVRGQSLRVPRSEWLWLVVPAILFFVGGNGLLTAGEVYVASGVASVLAATTPLWIALFERLWPHGERLSVRGWIGISAGLIGVAVLLAPGLGEPAGLVQDFGPLLILGSAISWALGSFLSRNRQVRLGHLIVAGYQMLIGGGSLFLIGLVLGEGNELTTDTMTPRALGAFFYLLVVGSIIGFTAFNWLLRNVSATMAGTYAYVNPVVAILVGWLINGEPITVGVALGIAIILTGVALVRGGRKQATLAGNAKRTAVAEPADSERSAQSETFQARTRAVSCRSD